MARVRCSLGRALTDNGWLGSPELIGQAQADIAECQAEAPPRAPWGVPGEPCMRERGYYIRPVE